MKIRLVFPLVASALLATSILPAHARDDFHLVVNAARENAITAGMTQGEVLARLGQPERRARYGQGKGPSWSYPVEGASPAPDGFGNPSTG